MARAYDVMAMAKRQGAEVKAVEEYDKYMDAVKTEEARASKAGMLGKIGGGIGGSIASYLAPAALGALGIGTGGIGTMLLAGALGTGISRGGTEIGDFLARQWKMGGKGRGKKFKDIGKMKGISGPYGQKRVSELQRIGKQSMETQRDTIAQMLDIENMNRWLSSTMSGLRTAGKVRGGLEGLKPGATIGEKIKAAMGGDVGAGYKLGAKDTGDWWQQKGIDRSLAKNIMTPTELTPAAKYLSRGGDIEALMSNVPSTDIRGEAPISDYFSGISKAEIPPAMQFAPPKPTVPFLQGEGTFNMPWEQGRDIGAFSEFGKYGGMEESLYLDELLGGWQSPKPLLGTGSYQVGQPYKSLTLLQQLLQGGR